MAPTRLERTESSVSTTVRGPEAPGRARQAGTQKPAATTATSGFEREFRTSMRMTRTPQEEAAAIVADFGQQFREAAKDAKAFRSLLRETFGDAHDAKLASQYRERALAGDLEWMPKVRFVDAATLGGAHGAFDAESDVVLLNRNLIANPKLARQVYAEELGHFLDAKLNRADTAGDEGEHFRRLLGGERLSRQDLEAIRADDDRGTITVDGRSIAVEFWKPFRSVARAVGSVFDAVTRPFRDAASSVSKSVTSSAREAAKSIASTMEAARQSMWQLLRTATIEAAKDADAMVWSSLRGRPINAAEKAFRLTGRLTLDAPRIVVSGTIDTSRGVVDAASYGLGPLGKPVRQVNDRAHGATHTVAMSTADAGAGLVYSAGDAALAAADGSVRVLRGDFAGARERFGDSAGHLVHGASSAAIMLAVGGVSALQEVLGIESTARKLTDQELAAVRSVYGDSIDYTQVRIKEGSSGLFGFNDRPFVVGNTIYMKDFRDLHTLVHEMGHVWQHQNSGIEYLSEALLEQRDRHEAYAWEKEVPATAWEDLNPEMQAELLADAWKAGFFTQGQQGYQRFFWDVDRDGKAEDLTAYMLDAAGKVRRGIG